MVVVETDIVVLAVVTVCGEEGDVPVACVLYDAQWRSRFVVPIMPTDSGYIDCSFN